MEFEITTPTCLKNTTHMYMYAEITIRIFHSSNSETLPTTWALENEGDGQGQAR